MSKIGHRFQNWNISGSFVTFFTTVLPPENINTGTLNELMTNMEYMCIEHNNGIKFTEKNELLCAEINIF